MNTIPKRDITGFVERLMSLAEVYAPVRRGPAVVFERIGSAGEVLLDHPLSTVPPKRSVFPQCEKLLSSCTCGDESGRIPDRETCGPAVLFGLRPCDARAFEFLDRVLGGGEQADPYYTGRRESLAVVSIGCTEPLETCFCVTTGGGPLSTEGSDILLEDLGDCYEAHTVTARGVDLAKRLGLEENPAVTRPLAGRVPAIRPEVDLTALKERLDSSFEDPRWQEIARKCIGCGICTFLCPACHCFDMVDEEKAGVRVRSRIWDSCQFPCFTEQASGFNPRPTEAERYRQRIMHKFSYCIERYGMPGCVGCGRCVSECPVNLDIRAVAGSFAGEGVEE